MNLLKGIVWINVPLSGSGGTLAISTTSASATIQDAYGLFIYNTKKNIVGSIVVGTNNSDGGVVLTDTQGATHPVTLDQIGAILPSGQSITVDIASARLLAIPLISRDISADAALAATPVSTGMTGTSTGSYNPAVPANTNPTTGSSTGSSTSASSTACATAT